MREQFLSKLNHGMWFLNIFIFILSLTNVKGVSQSLADCKTIAEKFHNTCTEAPDSGADFYGTFQSATITCSNMKTCPFGYGTAPSCTWYRKLCVSCYTDSQSNVNMRV